MPKRIDLSSVSPERARQIVARREQKAREYQRKREVILARNKAWQAANPEKVAAIGQAWRETNPLVKAVNTRTYYERNRDQVLARQAQRYRDLNDAVVRSAFCAATGLQSKDVPDELVPIIRISRLIKRELKAQS